YKDEVVNQMTEEFGYDNIMAVPKLQKISINCGVGEAIENEKVLDTIVDNLAKITGQRPVKTKAKQSVTNFKLRQGMPTGCKVTLRTRMMYKLLDRLVNLSLPRNR